MCGGAPSTAIGANISCFVMQRRFHRNGFLDSAGDDLRARIVQQTGAERMTHGQLHYLHLATAAHDNHDA
jgi:hypothetical protein